MKRILSILIAGALAISMCAALTGCGRDRSKNTSSSVTSTIKATTPTKPVSTTAPTETGNENQSTTIAVNPNDLSSIKPKVNYKNEEGAYLEKAALEEADLADEDGYYAQVYGSYKHDGKIYFAVVIFDSKDTFDSMWWVNEEGDEVIDSDTFYKDYIAPDYGVSNGGSVPAYYIDSNITPKSDSDKSDSDSDSDSDGGSYSGGDSDSDDDSDSNKNDSDDDNDGGNNNDNDNDDDDDGGDYDGGYDGGSDDDYNYVEGYDED